MVKRKVKLVPMAHEGYIVIKGDKMIGRVNNLAFAKKLLVEKHGTSIVKVEKKLVDILQIRKLKRMM